MEKETNIEFHIVRSVKGGSGKTAYSLFKALTLAQHAEEDYSKVLYIDTDFKGTALKTVIYAKDREAFKALYTLNSFQKNFELSGYHRIDEENIFFAYNKLYQNGSLNDFLNGNANSIDEILVNCGIYNYMAKSTEMSQPKAELKGLVDFVFSSPDAEEKAKFQYIGEKDNSPMLSIGQFKRRFEQLLSQIYKYNILSSEERRGQYDYVIIDMPPGEDEYSRTLLKAIEKFSEENKVLLYTYFVTTNDIGHITSEFEEFAYRVAKEEKRSIGYKAFTVVFNELRKEEFKIIDGYLEKLKDEIEKKSVMDVSKIHYSISRFRQDYYDYCRIFDKQSFGYGEESERIRLYDDE